MPCILKQRTPNSPGVITLTHNEALYGIANFSKRVKNFLNESTRRGHWQFGIHIQGSCNHLKQWPLEEWQSFIFWTNPNEHFLKNVPPEKILAKNCINFMPELYPPKQKTNLYDLVVISRASEIKCIYEILLIVRKLLDRKPDLRVTFMLPDERRFALGEKTYEAQGIDRRFYDLPQKLFSSTELWENLSFICTPNEVFGRFPLASDLMWDQISKSRFLLSFSEREGTPRAFAEALMLGVPLFISEKLKSGMSDDLDATSTVRLKDDLSTAADQILSALGNYDKFKVDTEKFRKLYSGEHNKNVLVDFLSNRIQAAGYKVEGQWYLNHLNNRWPCHGKRHSYQFINNPDLFFSWVEKIQNHNPYDEDAVLGREPLDDTLQARFEDQFDFRAKKVNDFVEKVQRRLKKMF